MKKPQPIQISIPTPCIQAWDEMTPNANGRFCGHCQKTVIDFTGYSDKSLFNFLAIKQGGVCGRFNATQLQRQLSIPPQPHSRLYRMFIALGMTLLFTQFQKVYAQQPSPKIAFANIANATDDSTHTQVSGQDTGTVGGIVIDEKKEPLIYAIVELYSNDILITKTTTDADGNFAFRCDPNKSYTFTIYFPSYRTEANIIAKRNTEIIMSPINNITMGVIVDTQYKNPLINRHDPSKKVIDSETIDKAPTTR